MKEVSDLPKAANPEDRCEKADAVNLTCASNCGFSFSGSDIGIFRRKDQNYEICVDNQAEFISVARKHTGDYAGIGYVYNPKSGWCKLPDTSHKVFKVEATINGLTIPCLPIIVT